MDIRMKGNVDEMKPIETVEQATDARAWDYSLLNTKNNKKYCRNSLGTFEFWSFSWALVTPK